METLVPHILESLRNKKACVLAVLIKRSGSAPREEGTRFLVLDDGRFFGTIGGGLFESRVLEEARRVLEAKSPSRLAFSLTGKDVSDTEMICGGEGEVFLEFISPENPGHAEVFTRAGDAEARGDAGIIATVLDPARWAGDAVPKAYVDARSGSAVGSLLGGREMPAAMKEALAGLAGSKQVRIETLKDDEGGPLDVLLEPVSTAPFLYVFGAGHIAVEIAPLAARVGFKVVVVDDRDDFASRERFPQAHQVITAPFEGLMKQLDVGEASYLVIVTRGHMHDKNVLQDALETPARYIGMIGSSRKIGLIYKSLLEEGVSEDRLKKVHAPIGLDIGAESPEEIAVSIVSELILVRAGGGKRKRPLQTIKG